MKLEEILDYEGMKEIRYSAISEKNPSDISTWAQCLLECECESDNDFKKIMEVFYEDIDWVGRLAWILFEAGNKNVENHENKTRTEKDLLEVIYEIAEDSKDELLFYCEGSINFNDCDRFPILGSSNLSESNALEVLRKLASNDYGSAQYLLGLSEDKGKDWFVLASENNFLLATYRLGFLWREPHPGDSIQKFTVFLKDTWGDNSPIDRNILDHLREEAHKQIKKMTEQVTEERVKNETQKEMLAFLAHTLTNSVAGSADTLRRIAKSLTAINTDNLSVCRRATERLAGLMTSFSITESLVSAFKLYATDPQSLKAAWESDVDGEVQIKQVVALALRQSLSRFFFTAEHAHDFIRLLPEEGHRKLSNEFIENALSFDLRNNEQADLFFEWAQSKLPFISLHIIDDEKLHITYDGAKYILIFSIICELLTNSLKYTSTGGNIELFCIASNKILNLRSENPVSTQFSQAKSGNKGVQFIKAICHLIGGTFTEPVSDNGKFKISASVPL